MELKDRIPLLRECLGLTQEQFGQKISLARNTIANYEIGIRTPHEQTIRAICREYNVSYIWLTQGAGEMFEEKSDDIVSLIDKVLGNENPTAVALFKAFAELDDSDWTVIQKIIDNLKK